MRRLAFGHDRTTRADPALAPEPSVYPARYLRDVGLATVRAALAVELGEAPGVPLLGAPRRPPLCWLEPVAAPASRPQAAE